MRFRNLSLIITVAGCLYASNVLPVEAGKITFGCGTATSLAGVRNESIQVLNYIATHFEGDLCIASTVLRNDEPYTAGGGQPQPQHLPEHGRAIDISTAGLSEDQRVRLTKVILSNPAVKGYGWYETAVHFDTRPTREGKGYWSEKNGSFSSDYFDEKANAKIIHPLIVELVYRWSRTGQPIPLNDTSEEEKLSSQDNQPPETITECNDPNKPLDPGSAEATQLMGSGDPDKRGCAVLRIERWQQEQLGQTPSDPNSSSAGSQSCSELETNCQSQTTPNDDQSQNGSDPQKPGDPAAPYANDTRPSIPKPSPEEYERMIRMVHAENCSGAKGSAPSQACIATAESIRNRAIARDQSYSQILRWSNERGGYYEASGANQSRFMNLEPGSEAWNRAKAAVDAALGGSNVCGGCQHNWNGAIDWSRYSVKQIDLAIGAEKFYTKTSDRPVDINQFKAATGYAQLPPSTPGTTPLYSPGAYAPNLTYRPNQNGNSGNSFLGNMFRGFAAPVVGPSNTGLNVPTGAFGYSASSLGSGLNNGLSRFGFTQPNTFGGQNPNYPYSSQPTTPSGFSGMFANLNRILNPFASNLSGGGQPDRTTQTLIAQQQLISLMRYQQQELDHLINTTPTKEALIQMLQRHLEQVTDIKERFSQADQTYLVQAENNLRTQLQSLGVSVSNLSERALIDKAYTELQQQLGLQITGMGGVSAAPYAPKDAANEVSSDLTASALRAERAGTNDYRFIGLLQRSFSNPKDQSNFSDLRSYFSSGMEHELLLDLTCDGSIDDGIAFETPLGSIMPYAGGADVLISEVLPIETDGLHCFAFAVDVGQAVPENNDNNNTSNWREFVVGFGQQIVSETTAENLPSLSFEVAVYNQDMSAEQRNWTTEDISIVRGQQLAFRWHAPEYERCAPLLSSLTPGSADNTSPTQRNTRTEQTDIQERTGYYEVRCEREGKIKTEAIHVTVVDDGSSNYTPPNYNPTQNPYPNTNLGSNTSGGGNTSPIYTPPNPATGADEVDYDPPPYNYTQPSIANTPAGGEQADPQQVLKSMTPPEQITYKEAVEYLTLHYISTPWSGKDQKAAARMGIPSNQYIEKYVIGGVNPKLVVLMAAAGKAMQKDGITLQITSGFRDDFRQEMATGFKARTGYSWHGGSKVTRGYGDGMAFDISGAKSQAWIDANGSRFGLARPYGSVDAPHISLASSREVYNRSGRRGGMSPAAVDAIYNSIIKGGN